VTKVFLFGNVLIYGPLSCVCYFTTKEIFWDDLMEYLKVPKW